MTARAAIVGIGVSGAQAAAGWRSEDFALDAARHALADAAIDKHRVDGLVTCRTLDGAGGDVVMGRLLGLDVAYSASLAYGTCNFSIHLAAMAIAAGLASTVLLTYGTDQGSKGGDFSRYGTQDAHHGVIDPIGSLAAFMFRRHQHLVGATEADLGAVVSAQRRWAALNPTALRRDPLPIAEYLSQPYLIAPVRPADIAPFDDGGVALVMTTLDRARDRPHAPVALLGMAQTAPLGGLDPDTLERRWMGPVASRALGSAGIGREAIDLLMIQDPSSVWVLQLLEAMGFAGPGEAGPMIAAGDTAPGGRLPLNTSGGHLAERYMWGWLHVVEIVRQLRGGCGARQVPGARHAMHASTMVAQKGSASVFGTLA